MRSVLLGRPDAEFANRVRATSLDSRRSSSRARVASLLVAIAGLHLGGDVAAAPLGQWVWSRSDLKALASARAARADIEAAVFVAELAWEGAARVRLRLPPTAADRAGFVVVRFDDSFHRAWTRATPSAIAASVDEALRRVLAASNSGFEGRGVQIDYDCPVRHLVAYAGVLRSLRAGALSGREVWMTSLAAHVREPAFGTNFAGAVDGHVMQVFDTGERFSSDAAAVLARKLEAAGLPFRVGLGAFERGRSTDHAAWLAALDQLCAAPDYRGLWIFAAGQDWSALARSLK